MSEILVTVIVPVYNSQKTLFRCVDTLRSQSLNKHLEVILVNDGSYDDSDKMCDYLVTNYDCVHVMHQDNAGMGVACNNAIAHARGKYIAFVKSDDFVEADMYETLYANAIKYDSDIVKCGMFFVLDEKQFEKTGLVHTMLWEEEILKSLDQESQPFSLSQNKSLLMYHSSVGPTLYRADFIKQFKFSTEPGAAYQDFLFSIKTLMAAKRISCVHKNLYCLNCDAPTTSGIRNGERLICIMDQIIQAKQYLIDQGRFDEFLSEFYKKVIIVTLDHYNKIYEDLKPVFLARWRDFFSDINLKNLPRVIRLMSEDEIRCVVDLIQK